MPVQPLLDSSTDCVKAIGLDGRLTGMNPEGICLMEIDDLGAVRGMSWSALWPEQHRPTLDAAVAQAAQGRVARFSGDCPTAKGTPKHWDVVVSPVHNQAGELCSLLAISRDVTREVLLARERALVTRELAHRIANLFTVIDGIIGLSARKDEAAGPFATALRSRLAGLGRAVSYVYGDIATEAELPTGHSVHGLIGELLGPYSDAAASRASVSGDDYPLAGEAVTPLALLFSELATNALKYGGFAQLDGRVEVITVRNADTYDIRWTETGAVARSAAPRGQGFGTTLIDRAIALQLGGRITRDWRREGLDVRIAIPLQRLSA